MNRLGEINHSDLRPLFAQNKKAKEKDIYTPFNIFKAATTHSSISKYAIVGAMLGWYSGRSYELGFLGAAAGGIKDLIPLLYNELPDDLKELADHTANVGLATLGTYAIYNSIPDIWVANIFTAVPNCIKHFPEAYNNFWNSPISTPNNPRTLEAAAKATMKFLSPLVIGGTTAVTGGLTALGFGQIRKFSVSAIGSYVGLESLKALGDLPPFRPITNIVKDFSKDRGEFISKVVDVAAAISAIPLSAYLKANPIQPITLVEPDASLSFYNRAIATATYIGGSIVNSAISPEFYVRALIIGAFALAHIEFNMKKPPEAKKELPEFEKITLEDIYDLLLVGLQNNSTEKANLTNTSSIVDKLKSSLEPVRQNLSRAVQEHHAELQTLHRDKIISLIDGTLQKLLSAPNNLGPKSRLLTNMNLIEALDLKLEELFYKMNGPGHKGNSVPAQANRAATKEQTLASLQLKFDILTAQVANLEDEYILVHNRSDGGEKTAKGIRKLIDRIQELRESTHHTIDTINAI